VSLLRVENLRTHFAVPVPGNPFFAKRTLKAVDGVSFAINEGEVLGLVGESGCGKTTVGRTLTRLDDATGGAAYLMGTDILGLSKSQFTPMRRHIQMVFQDPFASLNPRLTIQQTLYEPLKVHGIAKSRAHVRQKISEILEQVGIDSAAMKRYPHQFSGGQHQRIGIARALIISPKLVVADEPVSALDVSVQAQVLNLIREIQKTLKLAMLFISHDLGVVRYVSDRVAVMYLGRIVETGRSNDLFSHASHPYTRLLRESIPQPDPSHTRTTVNIVGEPANAADPPSGCVFHPRCRFATDICRQRAPELIDLGNQHHTACHHAARFVEKPHE